MKKGLFAVRCAVCFGVFIAYIALIIIMKSAGGALWGMIPLAFMPLFAAVFSFFYSRSLYGKGESGVVSVVIPALGLIAAGLLHFIADTAVNGFGYGMDSLIYDLAVLASGVIGGAAGVRSRIIFDNRKKRRNRFDD